MASQHDKRRCVYCEKEKVTYECNGCTQYFCLEHLIKHNREHIEQLDVVVNQRNYFQEFLVEQQTNIEKHNLFEKVKQWEMKSIEIITQTANEVRQRLTEHLRESFGSIELKLKQITEELNYIQIQNEFNEIHIKAFTEALNQLKQDIEQSNIIEENSSDSFINKISLINPNLQMNISSILIDSKWSQTGIIVAGGNGQGSNLNQLNKASSIYIDENQTIYIADEYNHRIVAWEKDAKIGKVIAGGNGQGAQINQLNQPSNIIVDEETNTIIIADKGNRRVIRWSRENSTAGEIIISNIDCWGLALNCSGSHLYVSDYKKDEVRQWKIGEEKEEEGILVAGGNGKGNNLHQLNEPRYISTSRDDSVYVSDWQNHRVMKWMKGAKQGIIVVNSYDYGRNFTHMISPSGIVVDGLGTLYLVESDQNRVVRWLKTAIKGEVIVANEAYSVGTSRMDVPVHLVFDRQNNLYVLNQNNHRVQKFQFIEPQEKNLADSDASFIY